MSNTVESLSASLNESYPVFEPSQLLTSNHLNQLRNYLDTQDRMSRVKLVGVGIVCGLEVAYASHTLTIEGGTGVTSEGFLIAIDGADYTGCSEADYVDPQNYSLFLDPPEKGPDVSAATDTIPIWELTLKDSDEAPAIDFSATGFTNFVNDKVVVLFLEYNDIDLESCLGENCDDKGINREFTIRRLLINCEDANKIIHEGYDISAGPSSLDTALNKRFIPEFLAMPSFTLIPGDTPVGDYETTYADIDAYTDIESRYLALYPNSVQNPLKQLASKMGEAYVIYEPLIGDIVPLSEINDLEATLTSNLTTYEGLGAIQYFYDHSKDLIKAYNEFIYEAFEVVAECCPDVFMFPRHLLLGKVTDGAGCPENENTCKPKLYRTHFIQSPIYNHQIDQVKKVRNLFERFILMIQELVLDYTEITDLKVTPSDEKQADLASRSIPFYYSSTDLYKFWNYELSKRCKENWNLGYHSGLFLPHIAPAQAPLTYNMDPYNFYRIESVLGKPYSTVVEDLEILKRKHQLDFNILPLKLKLSGHLNTNNDCGLIDIKEAYLQIRNEILVQSKTLNSFLVKAYTISANVAALLKGTLDPKTHGTSKTRADVSIDPDLSHLFEEGFFIYINELRATLPMCIDEFDFEEFHTTYKKVTELVLLMAVQLERLMRKISIYGVFIEYIFERLLIVEGYFGSMDDIYNQLKNNIDLRLWSVFVSYERRKQALEKNFLFSNFTYKNPGVEHMAGVPKGGTYILVYDQDGGDENVLADFALRANICCCDEQFLFCADEVEPYKPIARNIYYFITEEEYGKLDTIEIDVFEAIIDINIKEAVLSDLLGVTMTDMGAEITVKDGGDIGRKVIEYKIPTGKTNLFDSFEYRIVHADDGDMDDVGCVYVAVLPTIGSLAALGAFGSGTGGSGEDKTDETDETDETDGGSGTRFDGGFTHVWGKGKEELKVTGFHTSFIAEEENVAIDRYKETKDIYDHFVELGPIKEEPSAKDVEDREKEVVDKFKKVMDETVLSIEALDRQIGEVPTDAREKIKYEMAMADKFTARDALVSLYVSQAETLGDLAVEEGLATDSKGHLAQYFEHDVKTQINKLSNHTDAPKLYFEELGNKDGLDAHTSTLFKSF